MLVEDPFTELTLGEELLMGRFLARLVKETGISVVVSTCNISLVNQQADTILLLLGRRIVGFEGWDEVVDSKDPDVVRYIQKERMRFRRLTRIMQI